MDKKEFATVVESKHKLFDLKLQETFKYKDLIFLFVKRDFVSRYKQTILGPAWAVIQPLLTTLVFTFVFGSLAGLPTVDDPSQDGILIPAFLFYMAGNICWTYFSNVFVTCSNTFLANRAVMGKVYFPRMVTPISTIFSKIIDFAIQLAMLVAFIVIFAIKGDAEIYISWHLVLLPLTIIQMGLAGMGCGIIISALTTKYRDLAMLVTFGTELWRYATPVAYGLTMISSSSLGSLMCLYMLNPVTPMITTFRYSVFGTGYFDVGYYVLSWIITIVLVLLGIVTFNKIEKTFMDTI